MKALVIPAYRPSGALLELIESLPPGEFAAIVVVDDGGPVSSDIAELRDRGVTVVRHAVRVGRGAAIRTGMHAALAAAPDLDCIVVAEEFHSASDIARVSATKDALTLGAQAKTRVNWPTRVLAGIRVSDPGATLRSIPAKLVPHLLRLESNGAEFDVETLVVASEHSIPIGEEGIDFAYRAAGHGASTFVVLRHRAPLSRHDTPSCRPGVPPIRGHDRRECQWLCHRPPLQPVHLAALGPTPVASLRRAIRWIEPADSGDVPVGICHGFHCAAGRRQRSR